ncbi:hypothetical protein BC941DRAFT_413270 [Chlamydoabsidia padenii]|nr:hypothetical protein BC941DRAFT_413270 [Chlamydoabsidia padenii]
MYWQLNILWCVCIFISSSLASHVQQCPRHLTPFTETTCALEVTLPTDPSSILFPQVPDLDLLIMHKDTTMDYQQQQQHSTFTQQGQTTAYDSSPSSSPTSAHSTTSHQSAGATTSSSNNNSNNDRRVTIPSFEEWKKRIRQNEEKDDNRKPKRKSTRGAANQGRETIDSVDGGFSDDVGSVFDSSDPNGPVSTAENTYEEGEYIAPQKQQRQANKKHFAQVPIKSLKERFNYAWTICAATVRDVNKEARGAQSILFESKDQYLLNKCAADKFVIINLCEEILIDTIVLANFEFFSSTFKDFRVYVANTYPTNDWQLLGQWQAKNTRDLQVFKVQESIGWFEYIKIEFLTHYGHEYYCPLSLVRVHGMPMMEYFNAVESQGLSGDGESEALGDQHLWPADLRDDIIHPQMVTNTSEWFPSKVGIDLEYDDNDNDNNDNDGNGGNSNKDDNYNDQHENGSYNGKSVESSLPETHQHGSGDNHLEENMTDPVGDRQTLDPTSVTLDQSKHDSSTTTNNDIDPTTLSTSDEESIKNEGVDLEHEALPTTTSSYHTDELSSTDIGHDTLEAMTSHTMNSHTTNHTAIQSSIIDSHLDHQPTTSANMSTTTPETETPSPQSPVKSHSDTPAHSDTAPITPKPEVSSSSELTLEPTPLPSTTVSPGDDNRPKNIPNTHNKEPATQESIYKIIMKRLNALEMNATLSQRYLDEQNNMLNDVFTEMEKRHQDQLILVLDRLNETASNRIDSMKRRYEQSYGELKQQMETDMREMTAKISILTDQISFEKRVSMAQLAIVVTLFVFLALSRGTMSTLSPVMIAQAEERKRRESDGTRTSTSEKFQQKRNRRDTTKSAAATLTAMTKSNLDSSNKIKLGMEGRKAASLDALKLHLAQQANLLPKLPPPPPPPPTDLVDNHQHDPPRNRRSFSLDNVTNGHIDDDQFVRDDDEPPADESSLTEVTSTGDGDNMILKNDTSDDPLNSISQEPKDKSSDDPDTHQ